MKALTLLLKNGLELKAQCSFFQIVSFSKSGKTKTSEVKAKLFINLFEKEHEFHFSVAKDEESILAPKDKGVSETTNLENYELSEKTNNDFLKRVEHFVETEERRLNSQKQETENLEKFKTQYPIFYEILENNINRLYNNGDYTTYSCSELIYYILSKYFDFKIRWSQAYNSKPVIESPYHFDKKSYEKPEKVLVFEFFKEETLLAKISVPHTVVEELKKTRFYDLKIINFSEFKFEIF